jgi:cytochrome bd ubiquinol oxidase subunit I
VESFTPTLSYSAWTVTGITLAFYLVVSFAIIVTLRVSDAKAAVPEGKPVPAGAK